VGDQCYRQLFAARYGYQWEESIVAAQRQRFGLARANQ